MCVCVCECDDLGKRTFEMDTVTGVQIRDGAVYISCSANITGKGYESKYPSSCYELNSRADLALYSW